MPPKREEKKGEKEEEEAAGEPRVVGPGELDDDGKPRPQDVLELVAARMKLEKSMQNRERMEDENSKLRDEIERQSGEQTEVFAYLNKELSTKGKVILELEDHVRKLEKAVKEGRKEFDQRLMSEKSEARENTTKLAREVGRYEQELGDLNMFISRKTELENELEDTKLELLKERKKHEQIITDLERKTAQEKDRLRKEMEARIRAAKEKFMEDTDGQLEHATKETMRHNEQMASELAYQHRETERLVHKNRRLTEENLATRRELELYRHAEAELSKRNHAYLVTIQSLLSKLRALEGASAELSKSRATSGDYITSAYKNKVNALQESVEDTLSMLDSMRADLESKKEEVDRIRTQREELGFLVLQAAQEAKGHLTDSIYGQTIHEDDESLDDTRERRQAGPQFTQHVRLNELKGMQRHQVLRYIFERVGDLHTVARKNIMPDDGAGAAENVLFPRIDPSRLRVGTQSLKAGGSMDSERRRIKTGADHRSEGGLSR